MMRVVGNAQKLAAFAGIWCVLGGASVAGARTIVPTRFDDPASEGTNCSAPGGDCSLRNAMAQAQGGDVIDLRGGGTFDVTQPGPLRIGPPVSYAPEAQNTTIGPVVIVGAGAGATRIVRTAGGGSRVGGTGAVFLVDQQRTLTLADMSISGGDGVGTAGGVQDDGTLMLLRVNVSGNVAGLNQNEAAGSGGAIQIVYGRADIYDSAIVGNQAVGNTRADWGAGGGILASAATVRIVNSTIANNRATGEGARGGGIYQSAGGALLLANDTITANQAAGSGGGLYLFDGVITLHDSLIAANKSAPGTENCGQDAEDARDHFASLGHNVEVNTDQCGLQAGGDIRGLADPFFAPTLARAALPYVALRSGVLAVDAGDPAGCTGPDGARLTGDERSAPRPQGARCDSGAYELQAPAAPGCHLSVAHRQPRLATGRIVAAVRCTTRQTITVAGAVVVRSPSPTGAQHPETLLPTQAGRRTVTPRRTVLFPVLVAHRQRTALNRARRAGRALLAIVSMTARRGVGKLSRTTTTAAIHG